MARWGKAGVRLTDEQIAANNARARATKEHRDYTDGLAYQCWREGRISPASITLALDAHGLEGPEVDEACGAREPDVDRWEAGVLYPTWDQLCKLAKLCLVTPYWFTFSHGRLDVRDTSMRFHIPAHAGGGRPKKPVLFFTPEAIAATVRNQGR